jgi:hypothetical protein
MIIKKLLKIILIMKKIILRFSLHTVFHGMMVVFTILEMGEISRATYMKSMGLKFSARTNL